MFVEATLRIAKKEIAKKRQISYASPRKEATRDRGTNASDKRQCEITYQALVLMEIRPTSGLTHFSG